MNPEHIRDLLLPGVWHLGGPTHSTDLHVVDGDVVLRITDVDGNQVGKDAMVASRIEVSEGTYKPYVRERIMEALAAAKVGRS